MRPKCEDIIGRDICKDTEVHTFLINRTYYQ